MSDTAQISAPPRLSAPVGRGGANRPGDVMVVQHLLNLCIGSLVPLQPVAENGQCGVQTVNMIEEFERRVLKMVHTDARVDPGGRVLEALVRCSSGKAYLPHTALTTPPTDKTYTNNPHEVVTKRTTPSARDVVQMLLTAWPDLKQTGARTLTAQFMAETGDGRYCFNWNLGNVKAGPNDQHMYLRNVWECESEAAAKTSVANANGLAHIATAAERKQHGWNCPAATVVYQPPHAVCRFRAYNSLADGAQRWVQHHQRIALQNAKYLPALTSGDIPAVAHALKEARYFTASEASYAQAMSAKKKVIDSQLGPP
jgi:hypothetical protein